MRKCNTTPNLEAEAVQDPLDFDLDQEDPAATTAHQRKHDHQLFCTSQKIDEKPTTTKIAISAALPPQFQTAVANRGGGGLGELEEESPSNSPTSPLYYFNDQNGVPVALPRAVVRLDQETAHPRRPVLVQRQPSQADEEEVAEKKTTTLDPQESSTTAPNNKKFFFLSSLVKTKGVEVSGACCENSSPETGLLFS